jgi:alkylmercury lyase
MPLPSSTTRLETLAHAIIAGQERYQRHTPLFDLLLQLLAQGQPVSPERLALALLRPLDEVLTVLDAHPELEHDAHGNIVGSGLTLLPTPHQFQVDDQTLFTWCAMDTLFYPVRLKCVACVASRCPTTGLAVRLTVTPDQTLDLEPPTAVISLNIPDAVTCCENVREDVCNYSHFFVSQEAAATWLAAHPHAMILPVAEAYQVGALVEEHYARSRHARQGH